jgi:hypothetical protein
MVGRRLLQKEAKRLLAVALSFAAKRAISYWDSPCDRSMSLCGSALGCCNSLISGLGFSG